MRISFHYESTNDFVVIGKERDLKEKKKNSNFQVHKLGLIIIIRQKES